MQTFSTDLISQANRLAYWNEVVCKTYLVVGCNPVAGADLAGHLHVRNLGDIEVSEVVSPPMVYRRSTRELRSNREEHYQLVHLTHGHGVLQQDGREAIIKPGDLTLYCASRPSVLSYPVGSKTTVFKIPREAMIGRSGKVDQLTAVKLQGSNPVAAMIAGLMRSTISLEPGVLSSKLANGILEVVGGGLDSFVSAKDAGASVREEQLRRIKSYILNNLADSEMHIEEIALSNNISVRTLNRLFAEVGTTAFKWLWDQRLAASHKLLSEGRVRRVSEAAFSCGFNDLSHFSKAFKKRYSVSPIELLAGALRVGYSH